MLRSKDERRCIVYVQKSDYNEQFRWYFNFHNRSGCYKIVWEEKIVILTDSKNVLESLLRRKYPQTENPLICNIVEGINDLKIPTQLYWVKWHSGIKPNEIVDRLAKKAISVLHNLDMKIPENDIIA